MVDPHGYQKIVFMLFGMNLMTVAGNEPVLSGLLFCFRFALVNVGASQPQIHGPQIHQIFLALPEGPWSCEIAVRLVRLLMAWRD